MEKAVQFIKDCGAFFVVTTDGDIPKARPFGAIMSDIGKIYITTSDIKDVYKQLKCNNILQIVAIKPSTRSWIRIEGKAEETPSLSIKERMLKACPSLSKYHKSADEEHFIVFEITPSFVEYH